MKYYGPQLGLDGNVAERHFHDHQYYEDCVTFCCQYDQEAFDPSYPSLPLEFFEPMVREVFSRAPYWHSPGHPKKGAVLQQ